MTMKKLISIILILIICQPVCALAEDSYISLDPYPYSSHTLGEDLIIYGDTDFSTVVLGLYYPNDEQGYMGYAKYVITISGDELRSGYVIPTETYSRLWPEGVWKIVVQNGENARDEISIPMTKEAIYNRNVMVAEYSDNMLTTVTSYRCRGVICRNNTFEFITEDNTVIKVFSWNNFTPTDSGETSIFIAFYKDGYMLAAKVYTGVLSRFDTYFTLDIPQNKQLKFFYWDDNMNPID